MSQLIQRSAPAKLNLFLHITGRRSDGYHELQTIFQFLDFGDTLTFEKRADADIVLARPLPGVPVESDLVYRAASLLRNTAEAGRSICGMTISVEKKLPMGGGLGGGSSNAATTLVALNELWELGQGPDSLAAIGLQLGADVPVFVHGRACWAEGVGESFTDIDLPEPWFVVLCPDVAVSTAEIFNASELTRNSSPITIRDFLEGAGRNVCEDVVRTRYPEVDVALECLERESTRSNSSGYARMTGTGACVFASCSSREAAVELLDICRSRLSDRMKVDGFVAKGLNQSPLYRQG